jgi:hypothetical protein
VIKTREVDTRRKQEQKEQKETIESLAVESTLGASALKNPEHTSG